MNKLGLWIFFSILAMLAFTHPIETGQVWAVIISMGSWGLIGLICVIILAIFLSA